MEFKVKEELLNKIVLYLRQKPFMEVAALINELSQLKPEAKPETKKEEKVDVKK